MSRTAVWLVALALVAGCRKKDRAVALKTVEPAGEAKPAAKGREGAPAKRGSLRREENASYAVIAPPGADTSKLAALANKDGLEVVESTPAELGWHADAAEYYGSDYPAGDVPQIRKATFALSIVARGKGAGRRGGDAAIAVANACHGWILDVRKHQLYTATTIVKHLPGPEKPDVRDLIVVHQVAGEGDLAFLDTAGMAQVGLPELYLPDVPPAHVANITTMLNATAQTLVERGDLTRDGILEVDAAALTSDWHAADIVKDGGTAKVTWNVVWSRAEVPADEELVDSALQLELTLPGSKRGSAEALLAAQARYFGDTKDEVHYFDYDDELAAAGVKAREALAKQKPRFAKGIPPNEQLAVKAPFKTDTGGTEWMWIDVVSIKGDVVDGTLDNDPDQVSSLKIGARVKVKFGELADFIHTQADGKRVGGYSLEVMRAHGENIPPL